jgi:kynurenine formamidase
MQTYPGDPPVAVESHATAEADGYRVSRLSLGTHAGTHVDAPSHTEPDGRTLGSFGVERFRFDAVRVDCRGLEPRTAIDRNRLPGRVDGDLLVLDTGWSDHWGTPAAYDHPYLSADAAAWCADQSLDVATDAMSVDPTPRPGDDAGAGGDGEAGVPAHHALLGRDRLILENLTNLSGLPGRFELHAYPLAVDGDGAPVRAVAVLQ